MKFKLIIITTFTSMFFLSCSPQDKVLDVLEINLRNDWNELSKNAKLEQGLSDTSEYLFSYSTKNMDKFKIGEFKLLTEKSINNSSFKISTENQVSFIFNDTTRSQLIEIEAEIGFLENDRVILDVINKKYGKGELLSEKGSINEFKGRQNYLWKNLKNDQSLIISTFLAGNTYSAEENSSTKTYTCRFYLIDNSAEISYPNGQRENLLERVVEKASE
ncbi:hypothetical protein [Cellulophaga sp. Z1A5H]|uniref:hypothetical protein n=1 Tax=Cellulophaga sp. Z1A5H TaxID=2687291 RepID=UPI0013FDE0C0|nr:hypothetical protein [Cellulophaga sp. Z1A5H]